MPSRAARTHGSGHVVLALSAAVALVLLALTFLGTPISRAAAGAWGSGSWPYSNGVICDSAGGQVPLVAWRLDGVNGPAFLTTGISETSGVESGHPPIATSGSDAVVDAANFGSLSENEISAIAYLISTWGNDPRPSRVAEVSELIAGLGGEPLGTDCLATSQGGTSLVEAQNMRTQALRSAGPYTVKLTSAATTLVPGQPTAVSATVVSALGYPAPGIAVQFTGTGISQPVTATTDSTGVASAKITAATPAAAATGPAPVALTATVSAPIGLRVRISSGAIPAVYADAPVASSGSLTLPIAQPGNVKVAVTTSARLALAGSIITTTVTPTGLNGYAATATVTTAGPLPAGPDGSCRALTAEKWASAISSDTSSLNLARADVAVVGDQAVAGPSITVSAPGCYAVTASLVTANANPTVTTQSAIGAAGSDVTVVATAVKVQAAPGQVALAGVLPAQLLVSGGPPATGTLTGELRGPVAPISGECPTTGWDQVTARTKLARTPLDAGGTTTVATPALTVAGCYAVDLSAVLTIGDLGSITVPFPAGTTGTVALVLTPTMRTTATTTWVDTYTPEKAIVTVYGTLTQPGELTTTLMWAPPNPLGCTRADWRSATVAGASTVTSMSGDGTYPVVSVATSRPGCYSLVTTLTLTANRSATITGDAGSPSSIVLAANVRRLLPLGTDDHRPSLRLQTIMAGIGFAVALSGAFAGTALLSRRAGFRHLFD